jgi:hypothetical protein
VFRRQINWTVEDVEQMIKANNLKGKSLLEVKAFLDKHGISCHYGHVNSGIENDDWMVASRSAGLTKKEFKKWMRGVILNAQVGLLLQLRIDMYFFFDDQDRVIAFVVTETNVGL